MYNFTTREFTDQCSNQWLHFDSNKTVFAESEEGGELRVALDDSLRFVSTGFEGDITYSTCACGQPGPRLVNLRSMVRSSSR